MELNLLTANSSLTQMNISGNILVRRNPRPPVSQEDYLSAVHGNAQYPSEN